MKTFLSLLGAVAVVFLGCGPNGSTGGGGGAGGGATCHVMEQQGCPAELAVAEDECAAAHGTVHPDPIVCEDGVMPDGNCRALELGTECGDLSGRIWCCNENTSASCEGFNDGACSGPSSAELAARCAEGFDAAHAVPYTCAPQDGPLGCKLLSAYSPDLVTDCGQGVRNIWCCKS